MEHAYTNELINETSPYLLQHAHNPVNWYAWSETALAKAKRDDKPILVSIGYAACHWCHVMEKESFENEDVAAYMNKHFINIKIDREERPDLDHIYMDAVQAIAGNGGWPLNVFLTTDAKPFYGGTYFPPQRAFNRSSWIEVLTFIVDTWQKRREEVEQQATILLEHIDSSQQLISQNRLKVNAVAGNSFTTDQCKLVKDNILKSADKEEGGFGNAPKFPQTFTIQYLLAHAHQFNDDEALQQAELSLHKMLDGGIYDHLAGGMSRYSTDSQWLAPHFEKMLYDNALLVNVMCDAYQVTGDDYYKNSIEKTLRFFIDEMQNREGGFYAALDADSEGIEGKFYVWDKDEIDILLNKDSKIFCEYYGVTERGNWEHKNILHVKEKKETVAKDNKISIEELERILASSEKKLLVERNKRIRPATDDKILLGWNALLVTSFCKAYAAIGNDDYKNKAVSLFDFLVEKFSNGEDIIYHSYKNNQSKHPACLDDYAYLVQACIFLQEITADHKYLNRAKNITEYIISNFQDIDTGFFYYTHRNQTDVIVRKVEIYDGAVPSGNSIMAEILFYLSVVFDNRNWWQNANKMLIVLSDIILKYPTSFAVWAGVLQNQTRGVHEIVITGKDHDLLLQEVLKMYIPGKVLQSSEIERELPLLKNKIYGDKPLIFVCKNYSCSAPLTNACELNNMLKINGR